MQQITQDTGPIRDSTTLVTMQAPESGASNTDEQGDAGWLLCNNHCFRSFHADKSSALSTGLLLQQQQRAVMQHVTRQATMQPPPLLALVGQGQWQQPLHCHRALPVARQRPILTQQLQLPSAPPRSSHNTGCFRSPDAGTFMTRSTPVS